MSISAARLLVEAPNRAPLRFGLMSVAQTPEDPDQVHTRLGVRFEPFTCDPAEVTCQPCPDNSPADKIATEAKTLRGAMPFSLYTRPVCSSVGFAEEAQRIAEQALLRGEGRALESVFWTGETVTGCPVVTPHLAADTAVEDDTGPNDVQPVEEQTAAEVLVTGGPVEALARVEEALGDCYGNEGVIHVPPSVLTWFQRYRLVERDGPRLRSPSGHLIAAGAGYPGTGPDGSDPPSGTRWIYATGAIVLRRGPVNLIPTSVESALDRSKNDIGYIAERTYVVGWDCCHFAANVCIEQVNVCNGA